MCANHLPARVAAVTPEAPTPDNEGERLVALGELELADLVILNYTLCCLLNCHEARKGTSLHIMKGSNRRFLCHVDSPSA